MVRFKQALTIYSGPIIFQYRFFAFMNGLPNEYLLYHNEYAFEQKFISRLNFN
ncbi:hypothetical protein J2Y40_001010 [Chryseobacterium sp. 2987]|nr:hypothetical protein [Chryseobacterium sp. 2987]